MGSRELREDLDAALTVRVPGSVLKQLKAEAQLQDRSINSLALRAMQAYLADPESGERALRAKAEGKQKK